MTGTNCRELGAAGSRHKQSRRRAPGARARPKASLDPLVAADLLFANCAHADPPTAWRIAANDPVGAEVHAGLGLPPGTDNLISTSLATVAATAYRQFWKSSSGGSGGPCRFWRRAGVRIAHIGGRRCS